MGSRGVAIADVYNGIRLLHFNWTVTTLLHITNRVSGVKDGVFSSLNARDEARTNDPNIFHKLNDTSLIFIEGTGRIRLMDFNTDTVTTLSLSEDYHQVTGC